MTILVASIRPIVYTLLLSLSLVFTVPVGATVTVSGPDDGSAYFPLFMPTGQFDERGLSGFEFFVSGTTGQFNSNDQYVIQGEDTNENQTIRDDLGGAELLTIPFDFSIQHNLVGGRNFTFSLINTITQAESVLCWGLNCEAGSISQEMINGFEPLYDYNGLQVQVRAQDVIGATATVEILGLSGVTLDGSPLFDETVTLSSPGTIIPQDAGRRGQWFMADDNDLTANEWELFGTVTLNRPDGALTDRTKVRLAVDFVRDESLPFVVPEPSTALLAAAALGTIVVIARSRGRASS